jgi:hypothetical protein
MKICRTFSVFVLAFALPLSASAATHHKHAHHRHRSHKATAASASQLPGKVVGSDLEAAPVSETRRHTKRRMRGVVPPQTEDAAVFIPPARIRHIPAPMKGSRASLLHQNEMAEADHMSRIQDDEDLARMRKAGLLVPIPVTAVLRVNPELPANRRYTRPWTSRFLSDISRAHYRRYHSYIQVNSAVRTVGFQRALLRVNGNAAPAEGDIASPHLTGQAVDIAKRDLNSQEIAWMRLYLAPLQRAGKIDVAEEFQQACFHISVYKNYVTAAKSAGTTTRTSPNRIVPAPARRRSSSTALLATRMR